MKQQRSILKVASLVAVFTIISKILGLIRDLVIAHYFGTSVAADAYNMAYIFTGNIFIIFGGIGGPFYSSIVATLPKISQDPKQVWSFLTKIIWRTLTALVVLTVVFVMFEESILSLFINPETKAEYFNLTLQNINILLPLILLSGPIGIIFAVLNCYNRYSEASLAPGVLNLVLISTVLMLGDGLHGLALAIGTSIGGLLSFVFQLPAFVSIKNQGKEITDDKVESSKSFFGLLLPALISTGIGQVMVYVDSFFIQDLGEGAWTALVFGNRLVQMPLGVLMTAFFVPVFPRVTEMVKESNMTAMIKLLKKAITPLVLISVPGIIIGMLFAQDIIKLVFEHGAFNQNSTALVSEVFFFLCLSIIPYIFRDSFSRTLYSFGDSLSPLYATLVAIIIKIGLNYLLTAGYGLAGITVSTVVASCTNALILFFLLRSKISKASQTTKRF